MSLTKNDLKQINHLFIQGIESLILPQFEEIRADIAELQEGQKQLRKDLNRHVVSLHTRIDENTALIGTYFEDCVTKKDHKPWEKRIQRLEVQTV